MKRGERYKLPELKPEIAISMNSAGAVLIHQERLDGGNNPPVTVRPENLELLIAKLWEFADRSARKGATR